MREIKIEDALESAISLLENQANPSYYTFEVDNDIRTFQYFYLFSNEDLSYFFENINVKDKNILTTGSSGDQILYSLLNGASNVVHFDLNPYSKYYFYLKCALIKNIPYKYFKRLFKDGKNPTALCAELYSFVSHDLPKDIQYFWDELYLNGFGSFKEQQLNFSFSNRIPYTKNEYIRLQEFLTTTKALNVEFINCDFIDLKTKLHENEKFDVIMLSNIYDYKANWKNICENHNTRKYFKQILNDLEKNHLNKNGIIQTYYCWNEINSTHSLLATYLDLKNYAFITRPYSDEGSLIYAPTKDEPILE